jgi:hypothetical protein
MKTEYWSETFRNMATWKSQKEMAASINMRFRFFFGGGGVGLCLVLAECTVVFRALVLDLFVLGAMLAKGLICV